MNETTEHYLNEHALLKNSLPGKELPWLDEYRTTALQQFNSQGFPTLQLEDWKYTNVRPIEKHQFKLAQANGHQIGAAAVNQYRYKDMPCHLMVFIDGYFSASLSDIDELPDGINIKNFSTALQEDGGTLKTHLGSVANIARNGFAAMNSAFMNDGALIELRDNQIVNRPIHLMFLSTSQSERVTHQPRILILAGNNSQAKIIESYHSLQDNVYFNNVVTEVKLNQDANIEHYKIQQESKKAFHIATLQAYQQRNSTFTSHSISLGSRLARNDINSWMDDEHACCNLYGLYIADERQHTDFHTRIDHAKPHCTSKEAYKGILDGHSRAVFNGQVHVHPDAQKSDAQQTNNNLLLSKNAEVDTKPQLEIYADDITASHGATVGQLDENMMFYLRSRGIDHDTAHALLIYGFARSIVEKISLQPLQKYLENRLFNNIPDAAQCYDAIGS